MNRSILSTIALAGAMMMSAQTDIVTLDLTKATTELTFDAESGKWDGTYNDDAESIESQCFSFVHNSMGDSDTWWGFTASNSHDNARPADTMKFQWSNMAAGGIELNDDGSVKKDENGMPVVNPAVPYMVAYANTWFAKHPASMVFNDGKNYEPVGVYINLNSYAYYSIVYGDSFARAFRNGDSFKLIVHGVAADESEKILEVELASYTNGDLTINRGWKYVDLSSLGAVNEIYFSMKSTDAGAYGDNTPTYFCLDKLMVKPVAGSSINAVGNDALSITYDRANKIVNIGNAGFASVYDCAGNRVMSTDSQSFSISSLAAGVYIVKTDRSVLKIAK